MVKLIREKELRELIGLSKNTIRRMEIAGDFPNRIKISERNVAWKYSEVLKWINSRSNKNNVDVPPVRG